MYLYAYWMPVLAQNKPIEDSLNLIFKKKSAKSARSAGNIKVGLSISELPDSRRVESRIGERRKFSDLIEEISRFFRMMCFWLFERSENLRIQVPDVFFQFQRHFWNRLILFLFLFQFFQLFGQITFTVTMKHRFFLIDTIFCRELDLVVVKPDVPWECRNIFPKQSYYENDTQYARESFQIFS